METCPNCQRKELGKIGVNDYYCRHCFVEITIKKNKQKIYHGFPARRLLPQLREGQKPSNRWEMNCGLAIAESP